MSTSLLGLHHSCIADVECIFRHQLLLDTFYTPHVQDLRYMFTCQGNTWPVCMLEAHATHLMWKLLCNRSQMPAGHQIQTRVDANLYAEPLKQPRPAGL